MVKDHVFPSDQVFNGSGENVACSIIIKGFLCFLPLLLPFTMFSTWKDISNLERLMKQFLKQFRVKW